MENPSSREVAKSPLLTEEDLEKLRAPFPESIIHVKVQSLSKDRTNAMLVKYLQHTDVMNRLDAVDPAWRTHVEWREQRGNLFYVAIALSVKGVTRENVGEGDDPKGAYSDALKRAGMLFGIGRYLYDEQTQWVDYNEQKDKFRKWSVSDFKANPKPVLSAAPKPVQSAAPQPAAQRDLSKGAPRISEKQVWRLYAIGNDRGLSQPEIKERLMESFGHDSAKDLVPSEYNKFCDELLKIPSIPREEGAR